MRKLIVALVSFIIIIVVIHFIQPTEVHAKTKDLTPAMVKSMKKGTLPNSIGSIGTSYKTLKNRAPKVRWQDADPTGVVIWKNTTYALKSNTLNSKVILIQRDYNYAFSKKSVRKLLGKPLKTNMSGSSYYKVGNYLVTVNSSTNYSSIWLGTKKSFYLVPGLGYN